MTPTMAQIPWVDDHQSEDADAEEAEVAVAGGDDAVVTGAVSVGAMVERTK